MTTRISAPARRNLRDGDGLTYRLALLLTDELTRRRGFEVVVAYFRAFAESDDWLGKAKWLIFRL